MPQADTKVYPSPPSLVKTLLAGFDVISNQIGLILFSISLDLLLWFGPKIRLEVLIRSLLDWMSLNPDLNLQEINDIMEMNRQMLIAFAARFNLFNGLRTFPVGIPSLMFARTPVDNPFGSPIVWQISSPLTLIATLILLISAGLFAGTLYFTVVAQAALLGKVEWQQAIKRSPWNFVQVALLSLLWLGILIGITLPLSCLLPFTLYNGATISKLVLIGFGIVVFWLLLPLIFAPHGIFINHDPMWVSVVKGARLTRFVLPSAGLFFLAAIILSEGMDMLWNVPSENSWLTTIGIVGHAFVTTSLLASSFIYYRDASNWLHRMVQISRLTSLSI